MYHIHCLFMIIAGIGVVLKIAYLVKYADKKTLHKYAKWTLIVGIVGALITGVVAMKHGKKYHKYKHSEHHEMMKEKGGWMEQWHEDDDDNEDREDDDDEVNSETDTTGTETEEADFNTIDEAPAS